MTPHDWLLLAFCVVAITLHMGSAGLAMLRCRQQRAAMPAPAASPAVSILRPVCGRDPHDELTLLSGFTLDYPDYELIFCCAEAHDPAVALVQQLIAAHPRVDARLLIGNHAVSSNPKLNNLVKAWGVARSDWIIMADSNVLMPPDYIQRLLAAWRPGTGIVCSPPIGSLGTGFWAELECAFLNTYQARWQYAADSLGAGFAQGKTMLVRRSQIDAAGGIEALASEPAEDAAATKLVRSLGLRARLVDGPFLQPLGRRTLKQVWSRQTRWARLRRLTFPTHFAAEILTGCLPPLAAAAWSADALELPIAPTVAAVAAVWFAAEALLARVAGWPLSWWSPLAWLVRDLVLPLVWAQAWLSSTFEWRGNAVDPLEGSAQAR